MKEEAHQHLLLHQESSRQAPYRPTSHIRLQTRWVSLYLGKVKSNCSIVESKRDTRVLAGAKSLAASTYPPLILLAYAPYEVYYVKTKTP
jgi:hypothetical protein